MTHRTDSHPAGAGAHCARCGARAPSGAAFCPYCAAPVQPGGPPDPRDGNATEQSAPTSGPTSGIVWLIACFPLIAVLFHSLLSLVGIRVMGVSLSFGIHAALVVRDFKKMEKNLNAGHTHKKLSKNLWMLIGAFLPPVYLFMRASRTDGRYAPFIVNTVLGVAIYAMLAASIFAIFAD